MPIAHQKARAIGAASHIHTTNCTPWIVQSIDDYPIVINGQNRQGREVRYSPSGENGDGNQAPSRNARPQSFVAAQADAPCISLSDMI
jgi:hypothetical protein